MQRASVLGHLKGIASDTSTYSASVSSSPPELFRLREVVNTLTPRHNPELDPVFFVSSLADGWIPRIVVVRRDSTPLGLVYAKEKTIGGVPLGIMYADATLGSMVVAAEGDGPTVLRIAVEHLFRRERTRALRLLLPPIGYEMDVVSEIAAELHFVLRSDPVLNHSRLVLPRSYDEFLRGLGRCTRRNLRYYRKESAASGIEYVPQITPNELGAAAYDLRTKCSIPSSRRSVERVMRWLACVPRPFACGLMSRWGEWLSVAAGYQSDAGYTMLLQLNDDRSMGRYSLSLVLRGYLIESMITAGLGELTFWAGVGGALGRYVEVVPSTRICIDSRRLGWRLARFTIAKVATQLPRRIQRDLDWIVPADSEHDAGPIAPEAAHDA